MPALIAFRAVQGLGAGAVQPMAITIIGDIYSLEERAKVQGYLASVWAISAVVGPTLGGVFSEFLSWRWIFFVNIPLCLLAALDAGAQLPREGRAGAHRIDYAGAVLLTAGYDAAHPRPARGRQAWAWARRRASASSARGVAAAGRLRRSSNAGRRTDRCRCGCSAADCC